MLIMLMALENYSSMLMALEEIRSFHAVLSENSAELCAELHIFSPCNVLGTTTSLPEGTAGLRRV